MTHIDLSDAATETVRARENDVLWDLCRRHAAQTTFDFVTAVQRLNRLPDPDRIETGQEIRLPVTVDAQTADTTDPEINRIMWAAALCFAHNNGSSDDIFSGTVSVSGFTPIIGRIQRARVFVERHPLYPERQGEIEYGLEFMRYRDGRRKFNMAALIAEAPRHRYMNYSVEWEGTVPVPVPESLRRYLLAFIDQGQWSPLYQPLPLIIGEI